MRILALAIMLAIASAVAAAAQDENPIIIIPGITGSELVNQKTGETVWFRASKPKDDSLRLPVSADFTKVRDNLVPGDIIRSVKLPILPRIDIYDGMIQALISKGGYHEESWTTPSTQGFENSIYVFPYDWRLDVIENARILVRKVESLRSTLKRPKLRFDIIAHSMGGIIARYAAMYGDADLPVNGAKPHPTWAGAKLFDKVVLLGTPNEGSATALNPILNGFSILGIKVSLPWIQNLSKFDLFTIPSTYELLPAPGTLRALDENFEPIDIDVYDPKEWTKYGWNAIDDPRFASEFSPAEQKAAPVYFASMLRRAKRLHQALASVNGRNGIEIHVVGSDCRDSLDAILLYRERKNSKWKTLFKPANFNKYSGGKVTAEESKKVMLSDGDGVVTKRSLETATESRAAGVDNLLRPTTTKFVCEEHDRLAANSTVQDHVIEILVGKVQAPKSVGRN